jgi:hypothetical protein
MRVRRHSSSRVVLVGAPDELIDAGEDVVVVVSARARGRASGAKVEGFTGAGVWTIRDGKIIRVFGFRRETRPSKPPV